MKESDFMASWVSPKIIYSLTFNLQLTSNEKNNQLLDATIENADQIFT